jgi:hypothetical protein
VFHGLTCGYRDATLVSGKAEKTTLLLNIYVTPRKRSKSFDGAENNGSAEK